MRVLTDVMTRGVFAVERGLGLREAARRMVERGVGAAIVLDGERLVGILTERDVLLAVASDRDQTAAVEDFMTSHTETVESSFFFFMTRPPPRSTLSPSTALFRSLDSA